MPMLMSVNSDASFNALSTTNTQPHIEFDFLEATDSHVQWRLRLIDYISGDANEAHHNTGKFHDCSLGYWLKSAGKEAYGSLSAFQRLREAHDEFHYFVEMIIARVNVGEVDAADSLLRNEFSQSTRRVLMAISEMHEASVSEKF